MREVAVIVPNYATTEADLELVEVMLKSLRSVEGDAARVIVVDDGSPLIRRGSSSTSSSRQRLERICSDCSCELVLEAENAGFSRTVNVGIRMAMADGMDVILANADLEFPRPFIDVMRGQQGLYSNGPAAVVGALLVYPRVGLIQHAGQFLSLLTREFGHVYQYAPEDLPEAQVEASRPVTHALALIRYETFEEVGLLDEGFRLGHEDVDFNVRVLKAGGECVYQPLARVIHHESVFRGRPDERLQRWQDESWRRFKSKWSQENLVEWVPAI